MHFSIFLAPLALCSGLSVAVVIPGDGPVCDVNCQVDHWLFTSTLSKFYAEMQRVWWQDPSQWNGIDWVHNSKYVHDDQCSVPQWAIDKFHIDDKNKPRGYNFLQACYRHDFGYANYRKEGRFTDDNREKIDKNFHGDMNDECDKYGTLKKLECKTIAAVYYEAVRIGGGK